MPENRYKQRYKYKYEFKHNGTNTRPHWLGTSYNPRCQKTDIQNTDTNTDREYKTLIQIQTQTSFADVYNAKYISWKCSIEVGPLSIGIKLQI